MSRGACWFFSALLVIVAMAPLWGGNQYHLFVLDMICINIIAAVGLNLVKGLAGQITVGHHGLYAVGAYASALTALRAGLPIWASLPVGVLVAAAAGLMVGVPSFRLEGAYLAMATLAFGESVRTVAMNWDWVGGALGLSNIPGLSLGGWDLSHPGRYLYVLLLLTVGAVIFAANVTESSIGRVLRAIRDDSLAASTAGISLRKYKTIVFVLSAAYAGLAGGLHAHLIGYIHPDNFQFLLMINFLLMIMVGGLGRVEGSIVGAIIVTLVVEIARGYPSVQMMFFGAAMVAVVLETPRGIVGWIEERWPSCTRSGLFSLRARRGR